MPWRPGNSQQLVRTLPGNFIMPLLFEFKARSNNNNMLEEQLQNLNPRFGGEDHQTDTYFNVSNGRLKLREGNIENALIHYHRSDVPGPKSSNVILYRHQPDKHLKDTLIAALGVKVIVVKKRRIWFVENVKIHFDTVKELGDFVEVEAIDEDGSIGLPTLQKHCGSFEKLFMINQEDFIASSYSDLLLQLK
jgi:predicted adenylyl cyclase CyaB